MGRELTGGESDRFWYAAGLNALISNPSRSAGLIMTKLRLFWNGYELSSVYHYHFYRLINPVLGMPLVQFLWLAPLAVVGTYLMLGGTPATRFVALFNLTICLGLVLFFVLGRYRLPMMPGALIAATFTLRTIAGAVVDHMRLRTGVYVICVVTGFKLAWPISIDPHFEDEFYKLGVDYHRQERPIEAESAYKKALGIREDHLFARRNLAMLYDATGRSSEALLHWPNEARLARRQGDQALADYAQHQLAAGGARR